MSKNKNKNTNEVVNETVNVETVTEERVTEESSVDSIDTVVSEEGEKVETPESTTEIPNETVEPEQSVEAAETVEESIPDVEEDDDEDVLLPDEEIIGTNVPTDEEETTYESDASEADPLLEVDGSYYLNVAENPDDEKLEIIEDRLSKAGLNHITTATGTVLVGPYKTEEDAIEYRKKVLGKGLRAIIVKLD